MVRKSKNKDFKKYLNFIIPAVIVVLLIILFFSYQNNSSSTSINGEGGQEEKSSLFGGLFEEDDSCKYSKGENCLNTPSKCVCKNDQICSPDRTKSDNLGCYTIVCGDGYKDEGENSETCCLAVTAK